jgi:hypothetical protein
MVNVPSEHSIKLHTHFLSMTVKRTSIHAVMSKIAKSSKLSCVLGALYEYGIPDPQPRLTVSHYILSGIRCTMQVTAYVQLFQFLLASDCVLATEI